MIQTLIQPDDWHLHLRDGPVLAAVVKHTARQFGRAIVMPNLKLPVTTTELALAYRARILAAIPPELQFNPLMTLYLTDRTPPQEIIKAKASAHIQAVKYYPAGATTHADAGVTDIRNTYTVLSAMEEHGVPLLVHGEVTDPAVDMFDRERIFIERELTHIVEKFPQLRIVFEHITTREAVTFVLESSNNVAATLTAHHLLLNRNALFRGGLHPHHYCLPVLKREVHRQALVEAATSGNPKFFLGTDSAPHARNTKESACGCAGIYTAHAAIELYAEIFEEAGALDKLEAFASFYGPDFYGLERNTRKISLEKKSWRIADELPLGDATLVPFRAGQEIHWTLLG
jgi:dihydroorotase